MATIAFLEDAPTQLKSADVDISTRKIDDSFINRLLEEGYLRDDVNDILQNEYFYIFRSLKDESSFGNVIRLDKTESPVILFEVYGRKSEYRASLFIDHELVELENGSTYVDFEVNNDEVVDLKINLL